MDDLKLSLFISYSHKDERLCKVLQKHLTQFERVGLISTWFDRKLFPGSSWDDDIKSAMECSDIILFLVSPDLLHSDYVYDTEIKQAVEQHNSGKSIVIPIMLKNCHIELTPLNSLQSLPTNLEPVCSKKWQNIDEAFFDVTSNLHRIINRESQRKRIISDEEVAWENAKNENTQAAYIDYIKNSKLKRHIEEALNKAGIDEVTNYRQKFELLNLELELERWRLKWVTSELHDSIGQELASIRLYLVYLERLRPESAMGKEEIIKNISSILDMAIRDVRNASHRSWPISTNFGDKPFDFDVEKSIRNLASDINIYGNIVVKTKFEDLRYITSLELKVDIFKIIQEGLHNILKHSKAKNVEILLSVEKGHVNILIRDDGIGFKKNVKSVDGEGLINIRSRIEMHKGTFDVNLPVGGGCELKGIIPIE